MTKFNDEYREEFMWPSLSFLLPNICLGAVHKVCHERDWMGFHACHHWMRNKYYTFNFNVTF